MHGEAAACGRGNMCYGIATYCLNRKLSAESYTERALQECGSRAMLGEIMMQIIAPQANAAHNPR